MTFRGVYRDGVIVPSHEPELPNGTVVRRSPEARSRRAPRTNGSDRPKRAAPKRMTKAQRVAAVMQAFGMYRNRPDWKGRPSIRIAADLRQLALGSRFRG